MRVSTNISTPAWNSFIVENPEGTIFQSPEMFELFEKTERFEPLILGCFDDQNNLCGILLGVFINEKEGIGKILSSRFVVYGGPLLVGKKTEKNNTLDILLKALIKETQKKALFIQFRNFFSWQEYLPILEGNGFALLDRLNFILKVQGSRCRVQGIEDYGISSSPLPLGGGREGAGKRECRISNIEYRTSTQTSTPKTQNLSKKPGTSDLNPGTDSREFVLHNMSNSRRRQIRNGLASGAEIIEPENLEQVKAFYHILYALYRYKVNKPLPDWSFFQNFYQQTLSESRDPGSGTRNPIGIIRLIRYEGIIIGGILSPIWQDKVIYEWYVCGLDHEYKSQYPSVLATWAAIDYALENNIQNFDFMGVGTPDKEYGVREFKARFGGEMVNYGRFTRVNNKTLYSIAELGYNVLALLKKI